MANSEMLRMARLGGQALMQWMQAEDVEYLDLQGADLRGLDFRWTRFTGALLQGADFREADLAGAYFGPRTFSDNPPFVSTRNVPSRLDGARFDQANLLAATFNYPRMAGCSFASTYLGLATFRSCDFQAVEFSGSTLVQTAFLGCSFDEAKGLPNMRHRGPSHVDLECLRRSPSLDPTFLRQTGFSDLQLDYLPDLVRQDAAIRFHSCFISHASTDKAFCDKLYERLVQEGVRTWYAPEDIKGGEPITAQLTKAINAYDKVVLVISEASMSSNWVLNEITWAVDGMERTGRQALFPITIAPFALLKKWTALNADTGVDVARKIREYFIPDFSNWTDAQSFELAVTRLLRDLRASEQQQGGG